MDIDPSAVVDESAKATCPDVKECINPFMYRAYGLAMNYDLRWNSTDTEFNGTKGYWVGTPFSRPNTGPMALKLYEELREAGKLTWSDEPTEEDIKKAKEQSKEAKLVPKFKFTHAAGVAAREHYEGRVISGELKANKTSWVNKHAGFTGVSYEELEQMHKELYAKATTTYVSKEKKLQKIQEAANTLKLAGDTITSEGIAELTGLDQNEIEKLVKEAKAKKQAAMAVAEEKTDEVPLTQEQVQAEEQLAAEHTQVIATGEDIPVDHMEPADEEILAAESTKDILVMEDDEDEDEENVVEDDELEEDEDEEALNEPSTTAVAATTATEEVFDFDSAPTVVDKKEVLTEEDAGIIDPGNIITAKVFKDSTMERIDTKCEAVTWKGDDGQQHAAYLVPVPNYKEMWLEPGLNLVGDHETGQLYQILVEVGTE